MGRTNRNKKFQNRLKLKTTHELLILLCDLHINYYSCMRIFLDNPSPPRPDKDIKYLQNLNLKIEHTQNFLTAKLNIPTAIRIAFKNAANNEKTLEPLCRCRKVNNINII